MATGRYGQGQGQLAFRVQGLWASAFPLMGESGFGWSQVLERLKSSGVPMAAAGLLVDKAALLAAWDGGGALGLLPTDWWQEPGPGTNKLEKDFRMALVSTNVLMVE